jgi:pimeloyl-ACP methyl ester carboxylesterase
VLLFVHGGPASPSAPTMWMYQRPLEELHGGELRPARRRQDLLENDPDTVRPTLRIDQFVDDAVQIAEQVSKRYGKRKVILVGHSWGTVVGMRAALKRPDLFHAYVGIGQVISMLDNEKVSFDFALAQARKENNQQALKELASIAPYPGDTPLTRERIVIERNWAQHYGGLAAYRGDFAYYFNAPLLSPEYDDAATKAIDQRSLLTLERVLNEWFQVDFKPVKRFPIPVVMFMGRHDYTTPSAPTAACFGQGQGAVQARGLVRKLLAPGAVRGAGQDAGQPAGARPPAGERLAWFATAGQEHQARRDHRCCRQRIQAALDRTGLLFEIAESGRGDEAAEIAQRVDQRDHRGGDAASR